MYSFIRQHGVLPFIKKESLALFIALTISELFYEFGSFTLECMAFLLTCYSIGRIISFFRQAIRNNQNTFAGSEKKGKGTITVHQPVKATIEF